jgi:hypothetical protein
VYNNHILNFERTGIKLLVNYGSYRCRLRHREPCKAAIFKTANDKHSVLTYEACLSSVRWLAEILEYIMLAKERLKSLVKQMLMDGKNH